MASGTDKQKVVVVGAGPVGALAALYAAKCGDEVHLYELRDDLRNPLTTPLNFTKSINLALSERGINSIRRAGSDGLLDGILQDTIPMHARMIHGRKKNVVFQESQAYDAYGRYIQAVDRAGLNKRLLDAIEKLPNVTIHFNHKLTGANFNKKVAWFEQQSHTRTSKIVDDSSQGVSTVNGQKRAPEIEVEFELLIGADGAHSAVRYHMMKYARVNYQQEYIDTLWCEFHIPPKQSDSFAIDPNHLHIWPAGSFMFIAIPSLDRSFTCTLFASDAHYRYISEDPKTRLPEFFTSYFPGVSPELISPDELQLQYINNPHLPLISIKCQPHHYSSSVVILGDAAHAMVPFYGQGMNAGLEDVRVLFDILHRNGLYDGASSDPELREKARAAALNEYTSQRVTDAVTINDLALRNYEEMRSSVRSPIYKMRKWMEETVSLYLPKLGWRTQYTRVSFENQRYSEVERDIQRQGQLLLGFFGIGLAAMCGAGMYAFLRVGRTSFSNFGKYLTAH